MSTNSICGMLRITALKAESLKNVQMLTDQDPFVLLKLQPWGDEAKTKAASGVNPVWDPKKHKSVMFLPYPGRPVPPQKAILDVKVMDAEMTRAARLIGEGSVDLSGYMSKGDRESEIAVKLKDAKGKDAGTVFLLFEVVLMGQIEVKVLNGTNLKNLQKFIAQDPYVRVSFLSSEDDAKSRQVSETKVASGVNPVWKKKNVLTFDYCGEESPRLLLECFDKEYTRKDRLIGSAGIDLTSKLINFRSKPNAVVSAAVELMDKDFIPAGVIRVELRFINSAYDESKPVVRGLSKKSMSVKNMSEMDLWTEIKSLYFHMESEMEHNSPDFIYSLSKTTKIPATILAMAYHGTGGLTGILLLALLGPSILSLLIGIVYPTYMSFKAIESTDKDDDTQWLTYWCCFGFAKVLQETIFRVLRLVNPVVGFFLFFAKIIFLIWLQHPASKGALSLYKNRIAPFFRRNEAKVDKTIAKAKKKAKEVDDAIRLEPDEPDREKED